MKPLAAKLAVEDFGALLKVGCAARIHDQSSYRPGKPSAKTSPRENAMNDIRKWIAFALFATITAGTAAAQNIV
jgi:hypothetical protein